MLAGTGQCRTQSAASESTADADTLTRARPLATSTDSVSRHTEENLGVQVDVPIAAGHSHALTEKLRRSRSPHPSSLQTKRHKIDVTGRNVALPPHLCALPRIVACMCNCVMKTQL